MLYILGSFIGVILFFVVVSIYNIIQEKKYKKEFENKQKQRKKYYSSDYSNSNSYYSDFYEKYSNMGKEDYDKIINDMLLNQYYKKKEQQRHQYNYYNTNAYANATENSNISNNPMYSKVPEKKKDLLLKLHMMAIKGTTNEKQVASTKIGNIVNSYGISKKDYNEWAKYELKKKQSSRR
jgi:hypothetical protein